MQPTGLKSELYPIQYQQSLTVQYVVKWQQWVVHQLSMGTLVMYCTFGVVYDVSAPEVSVQYYILQYTVVAAEFEDTIVRHCLTLTRRLQLCVCTKKEKPYTSVLSVQSSTHGLSKWKGTTCCTVHVHFPLGLHQQPTAKMGLFNF